jgi:hypothetical protein
MNEGVREKELSRSPGGGAGEFPFVPVILSVLGIDTDFDPRPGVEGAG